MRGVVITLLVLFLPGCGGGDETVKALGPTTFVVPPEDRPPDVSLTAAAVVGGSIETGQGEGRFVIDLDSSALGIDAVELGSVEAERVTLRRGFAGENGPALIELENTGSNVWSLNSPLILPEADRNLLTNGGIYLEAYTNRSPEGAVRGQLRMRGTDVWMVHAFGMQVVPPISSTGSAMVAITRSGTSFTGHVRIHGLNDVTAVHLHDGIAGSNGSLIAELLPDPADSSHWWFVESDLGDDAARTLDRGLEAGNPPIYVDVHTTTHPAGELRAQIANGQFMNYQKVAFLKLRSSNVVPPNATPDFGIAAITLTDIVGWDWIPEVALHLNVSGLEDADAVSVRASAVGQTGPVVRTLQRDPNDLAHWTTAGLLLDDPQDPFGGLYVSVATPSHPDGAIRAQMITRHAWDRDAEGLAALSVEPADGATVASLPPGIEVQLNQNVPSGAVTLERIELQASGDDAAFGDGNELDIHPAAVSVDGRNVVIDLTGAQSLPDTYRFMLTSSDDLPLEQALVTTFRVDPNRGPATTLQQLQTELFTPNCALSGCHASPRPAAGLDLSPGNAFASIHDPLSGHTLVMPDDPDASVLLTTVRRDLWEPHVNGHLHSGNGKVQMVREWIANGAQDN